MKCAIVIERAGKNYSAYVPDLPGCVATGRSRATVTRLIREAMAMHIEGMREDGLRVPRPSSHAAYVQASLSPRRKAG